MSERLPDRVEKIPRIEARQLQQEDDFGLEKKLIHIDPDDVWGYDIAQSIQNERNLDSYARENKVSAAVIEHMRNHELKKRGEMLDAAKRQVENLAKNGFGFNLIQLTNEATSDRELLERIVTENPAIRKISEVYKTEQKNALLGFIFGERGARFKQALHAIQFWKKAHFSDDIWFVIAAKHSEKFKETAKYFKEEVCNDLVRKTYNTLFRALRQGIFPISRERFAHTLGKTTITLADTMDQGLESLGGFYDFSKNKIALSSALVQLDMPDQQYLEKVLIHEYVHALDGRTLMKSWKRTMHTEEEIAEINEESMELTEEKIESRIQEFGPFIDRARQGLVFEGRHQNRFEWLNEAVTEMIVDEVLLDDHYQSYFKFREAVRYLINEGVHKIPFEMLKNAYFEDYDPNDAALKIPQWKKLRDAINKAHGPQFLVAFDDSIRFDGVETAIEKARAGQLR